MEQTPRQGLRACADNEAYVACRRTRFSHHVYQDGINEHAQFGTVISYGQNVFSHGGKRIRLHLRPDRTPRALLDHFYHVLPLTVCHELIKALIILLSNSQSSVAPGKLFLRPQTQVGLHSVCTQVWQVERDPPAAPGLYNLHLI